MTSFYASAAFSRSSTLPGGWDIPGARGGAQGQEEVPAESQRECQARKEGNHSEIQEPVQTALPGGGALSPLRSVPWGLLLLVT